MGNRAAMLLEEQEALDRAIRDHAKIKAVLEAIPDNLEIERIYSTSYCGAATAAFLLPEDNATEAYRALLVQFPPLACTYVLGSTWTIKPTRCLDANDHGARFEAYPVKMVSDGAGKYFAAWWTELAGMTVQVQAKTACDSKLELLTAEDAVRFESRGHSYPTGATQLWVRRMKRSEDIPGFTPEEAWMEEWRRWIEEEKGFSTKRAMFVRAIRAQSKFLKPLDLSRDSDMLASRAFQNIGDFWASFTDEEAQEIKAFSERQQEAYRQVPALGQELLEAAQAWLVRFFAEHGNPGKIEYDVLRFLLRKSGFPGKLNWAQVQSKNLEIGLTVDKEHLRFECGWNSAKPPVDWLSLAEYF